MPRTPPHRGTRSPRQRQLRVPSAWEDSSSHSTSAASDSPRTGTCSTSGLACRHALHRPSGRTGPAYAPVEWYRHGAHRRRWESDCAVTSAAAEQARRMVEAVHDDPIQRRGIAAAFYDDRPHRGPIRGYRRAELAFMDWQLRRGTLAPTTGAQPGSTWGRAVNCLLYTSD